PLMVFARDMGVVNVTGVALTQIDKLVLSRILDLGAFGWYSLASLTASSLRMLAMPVFTALYPPITKALERREGTTLIELYRRTTRMLCWILVPPATVLI